MKESRGVTNLDSIDSGVDGVQPTLNTQTSVTAELAHVTVVQYLGWCSFLVEALTHALLNSIQAFVHDHLGNFQNGRD